MLLQENLLTLAQAAKSLPKFNGKRVACSTVYRWIVYGLEGRKLEALRIGRRYMTSLEALDRFFRGLGDLPPKPRRPCSAPTRSTFCPRTPKEREKAVARAEARLGLTKSALLHTLPGNVGIQGTLDLGYEDHESSFTQTRCEPEAHNFPAAARDTTNQGLTAEEKAAFDVFWKMYPRKQSQKTAMREWRKAHYAWPEIQADLERRAQGEWSSIEPKFVPNPANYLRDQRWKDEPNDTKKPHEAANDPVAEAHVQEHGYHVNGWSEEDYLVRKVASEG